MKKEQENKNSHFIGGVCKAGEVVKYGLIIATEKYRQEKLYKDVV